MLISFEGIDGCGKSTQITLLEDYLHRKDIRFTTLREPGGTWLSEKIRNLLLHEAEEMDEITELLLFSAARSQLIAEKVIPLLKEDNIVILDRFYDSTTAYQGYGREAVSIEKIGVLNQMASHGAVPDLTFYLRISPAEAEKRTRQNRKDRVESSGSLFFEKVYQGYEKIADRETRFVPLDATQPAKEIHEMITAEFEKRNSL